LTRIYLVKVKFSTLEEILVDQHTNEINISINELPIKGRANRAIVKAISTYFNIATENVKIVHGMLSKTKFIEIS